MGKYKVIVPKLVSVETNAKKINGFYLMRNLNYFKNSTKELQLHYKIIKSNKIFIQKEYDFKNSNYQVKDNIWSYKISKYGIKLAFQYDYLNKKFKFNSLINNLPARINWTHLAGDYISDVINLDLFLNRFIVLNGIAFRLENEVYCFCSPSLNGKTTYLKRNKHRFKEIISDDYVILDFKNKKIGSTPLLMRKNNSKESWYPIDKIIFVINSTKKDNKKNPYNVKEFIEMSAMKFNDNIFIKNIIFYHKLHKQINQILEELENSDIFNLTNIENYNYEQFIRN